MHPNRALTISLPCLLYAAVTEGAIKNALANPRQISEPLVQAYMARRWEWQRGGRQAGWACVTYTVAADNPAGPWHLLHPGVPALQPPLLSSQHHYFMKPAGPWTTSLASTCRPCCGARCPARAPPAACRCGEPRLQVEVV